MRVDVPEDVKFFDEVTFSSYESVSELLLNCPVLEDLTILCWEWLSGYRLSIYGSALKKLSLFGNLVDEELFLDTLVLETLVLGSFASDGILIKENLTFLRNAHIDVDQITDGVAPSSVSGDCVFGLIKKINHVKSLYTIVRSKT
ncbi:hypothetical protein POM88_037788 [Heracleum sosnowskyi]|uniref:F-box/LRR-repeat protein n=1 Tax=Heracleum sosnowskyi TaxID=360622 RepID=A0AAD8HRS7_9APIA|nr:hypothetical protein POM88_037788 [Heracleum sosnowskyi]